MDLIRPAGQQLALSFDAQTNLLTKYDYLYADPITATPQSHKRFQTIALSES